ncbi:hypothetical protein EMIHUDRAFT_241367 [Emiliania huxleyi CCMP1516]|uniref:Transmembrane protein n=2 Tax=Emiliania huxleyi TaxID=2903 RepID=A0A0D3JCT5_EMIH1|nr:hypothetical protein EMIHUDRAFT_241367 [Emiliania huxleyi CCMP1516]EOD21320.1 hypothetical protein EMIHUDRAFT_241367 [Emiliania huxleyi CCMP1516]|eukprot:XP_005773749.1 hypothetical protein EMIHUDRAFT_241367 [Emiliania huxleyi CCMP1516]
MHVKLTALFVASVTAVSNTTDHGFEAGFEILTCNSTDCSTECTTRETISTGECLADPQDSDLPLAVSIPQTAASLMLTCDGDTLTVTSYTTWDCSDSGTELLRWKAFCSVGGILDDLFGDVDLGLPGSMGFLCKTPAATVVTSFTLAGAVEDFNGEPERAAIKAVLAAGAGVSPSAVSLTFSPGSVVVSAKILFKVSAAADAAVIALSDGILADATKLQEALNDQFAEDGIDTDVTVSRLEPPEVESDDDDGGICILCLIALSFGIVVGVLALIALSVLLFLWLTGAACFKKADGGYPTGKPGVAGAGEAA